MEPETHIPKYFVSSPKCSNNCRYHEVEDVKGCVFQVEWAINPYMQVGAVDSHKAIIEHQRFVKTLRKLGAEVTVLPFVHGAFDSVFVKDNAIVSSDLSLMANPKFKGRSMEQRFRMGQLTTHGVGECSQLSQDFEGGDFVMSPDKSWGFMGYGFRSSRAAGDEIEDVLGIDVYSLELCDPYFYHLDTALALTATADGRNVAFAHKEAFTAHAWSKLITHPEVDEVIEVPYQEAVTFGLNWVEVNHSVVVGSEAPFIEKHLRQLGKQLIVTPLSQFQLAGGSAACLTAEVHTLAHPANQRLVWQPLADRPRYSQSSNSLH